MTKVVIEGVLRLVAIAVFAWAVAEFVTPFVARHEVVLTIRPLPLIPHQQQRELGI